MSMYEFCEDTIQSIQSTTGLSLSCFQILRLDRIVQVSHFGDLSSLTAVFSKQIISSYSPKEHSLATLWGTISPSNIQDVLVLCFNFCPLGGGFRIESKQRAGQSAITK